MSRERRGALGIARTHQGCAEEHGALASRRARDGFRPPLAAQADEDLIGLLCEGDVGAFEELYARLQAPAYALANRLVRDPALAEEVVQDAFTAVWRRCGQYRVDRGSPRSWVLRIVHNHAIDGLRSQLRHDSRRVEEPDVESRRAAPELTDVEASRHEDSRTLRKILGLLPDEQRQVLELSYFADLSQHQIATALHVPLGTIKGRARLGLARMRTQLEGAFAGAVTP